MPLLLLGCRKLLINNMAALAHWNWRGPWRARLKGFNATILALCPYPPTMQWRLWESLITALLAPNLTILPHLFLPPKEFNFQLSIGSTFRKNATRENSSKHGCPLSLVKIQFQSCASLICKQLSSARPLPYRLV